MAALPLRREESLGLGLALAAHAAVLGWLAYQRPPAPLPLPERMEVTISDESGLTAASPDQTAAARDSAPVVSPAPPAAPPMAEPAPEAAPQPSTTPPPPQPVPARAAPMPAPQPRPVPAKAPSPPAKAAPKPAVKPAAKPAPAVARAAPTQARPAAARPAAKPGASAFDTAFNTGIPAGKAKAAAASAPAAITGAVRSSLASEVARALKRRWQGPNGLDVDKLVTTLEWDLNPDGSLAGAPRVLSQNGITPANQAQAGRHKEQAIKAVRLAAPFGLPAQFYPAWRHLRFTFDWKINQ